jgi:tetratricopeptide (TPR) repeat protein
MDHSNIARVLDAGATDTGRPYFVMELVKGIPITQFCDDNQLTTRERLELFVQICQAVQHAHHKGIIHRDLKPSNVLVTLYDGTPVTKVIDFGIAKALTQPLTDQTLFTGFAQMIGTPLYMSPEQAGLSGLDVDTRTDIYALGVLLYELLTGTTPFDKERLKEVNYDELRRIIREEEPLKPSTRVSTLGQAATTVSANRKSEPKRLSQLFRGELDWMVMKALEKDRNRRYDTASSFATDVQRYLHGEPVQASPLGTAYQLRKLVQKHKRPLLLAVAVVALLLTAVVNRLWMKAEHDARQAQLTREANEALNQATALRAQAKAATVGSGALLAQAREQMQRALALVEGGPADAALTAQVSQLQAEFDAEEKDRTLVAALDEAGLKQAQTLSTNRFAKERAVPLFREAFRAYGLAAGEAEPQAVAERIRQRPAAVREAIVAALEEWDDLAGDPKADITEPHREWLRAVAAAIEPDDAWTKELRAALAEADGAKRRSTLEQLAAAVDVRHYPPRTLTRLARLLQGIGPVGREYASGPAAVALLRRAQRQYPADFWINENLGVGLTYATGPQEWDEAVRYLTAAVALRPDSPGAVINLGVNLWDRKHDYDGAIACFLKAIELDPKSANAHDCLGMALRAKGHDILGNALNGKGQIDEAIAGYRMALELNPNNAAARTGLAKAQRVAAVQDKLPAFLNGDYQPATNDERLALSEAAADREIAAGRTRGALVHLAILSAANNPKNTLFFLHVAALQAWFGQEQEFAASCHRGLALAQNTTDPATAERVAKVCCLLPSADKAQLEAALALARKAVQLGKDSPFLPCFQMTLGMAEYRNGHFAAADAALLAAAQGGQKFAQVPGTAGLYRAMSLFRQGKENEARQLAREAASQMRPLPKDEKNPLAHDASHDDLILWLAYKEAKALIQFEPSPAAPTVMQGGQVKVRPLFIQFEPSPVAPALAGGK